MSFGELVPGIINPLDGTEKIAVDRKYLISALRICIQKIAFKTLVLVCFPLPVTLGKLKFYSTLKRLKDQEG